MPVDQKQYLIKLHRLATEPEITGTDQDHAYVYIILPAGQVPDLDALYTPHRSGLERYMGNLSEWTTDCASGPPPTTDPKDPAFKDSYAPPGFVIAQTYIVELDTANYSDVVTVGAGTAMNHFEFSAYPGWLFVNTPYDAPTKLLLIGTVPADTTTIPVTIKVVTNEPNGSAHSASKSFIVQPKVVVNPYMGYIFSDGNLQLFFGPGSSSPAWLTISTAPAGFTDRNRQQLADFVANNAPVLAVLGGKSSFFRKVAVNPPAGTYGGTYEINSKTKNWSFVFSGVTSAGPIILTDTPVDPDPGGGTIAKPTVAAKPVVQLTAGQQWSDLVAGYTLGAGQKLTNVRVIGAAISGYSIANVGDEKFQESYTVPANQDSGDYATLVEITQTDGQTATYERGFKIVKIPYFVRILHADNTSDVLQLGPVFTNGTVKVEGPTNWPGAIGTTNPQGVQNFEKYGASAPGYSFAARYIGYRFNLAGTYIFTFVQDGVTLYASLVVPTGGFTSNAILTLSGTKPTTTTAPQYYFTKTADTLNEGGSIYLTLMQHVVGQPTDTPVSGAEYLSPNAKTGTTVNASTGQVKVEVNSTTGDDYILTVQAKLNGVVVVNDVIPVYDRTPAGLIAPQLIDYAWAKNTPPTVLSRLDIYIKTNGGSGALEIAYSTSGPSSDYVTPKSGYSNLSVGNYSGGYTLTDNVSNAISNAIYTLYVRRTGTTTDLATVTLPAFPTSGTVPQTTVWNSQDNSTPPPVITDPNDQSGEVLLAIYEV